jgi:hypothetical protein
MLVRRSRPFSSPRKVSFWANLHAKGGDSYSECLDPPRQIIIAGEVTSHLALCCFPRCCYLNEPRDVSASKLTQSCQSNNKIRRFIATMYPNQLQFHYCLYANYGNMVIRASRYLQVTTVNSLLATLATTRRHHRCEHWAAGANQPVLEESPTNWYCLRLLFC